MIMALVESQTMKVGYPHRQLCPHGTHTGKVPLTNQESRSALLQVTEFDWKPFAQPRQASLKHLWTLLQLFIMLTPFILLLPLPL